ncbi:triose-phosphate isomerase [Massilia sp. W12]|uniref:triose-phosphate isomerase n=1 Tax=Massilia sp. W12 TaxID=3126507 RepID=UPI0030CE9072
MRRKLIAGNWKMHGSLSSNAALLEEIMRWPHLAGDKVEVAVCIPAPYLAQAQQLLGGSALHWGAQDVSEHPSGAFTGEVSAAMLAEFACRYAIVGHSERRTWHKESSDQVARKAAAALNRGVQAIICLGETLVEREAGQTAAVVGAQLAAVLETLSAERMRQTVLAYEPVWAIGTGKTATPEMAQEVHAMLRAQVAAAHGAEVAQGLQILYGGSMKPDNAAQLLAMPDIDGGLIGGAALVAAQFLAIADAAQQA